jgi:hypothetical protein
LHGAKEIYILLKQKEPNADIGEKLIVCAILEADGTMDSSHETTTRSQGFVEGNSTQGFIQLIQDKCI